MTDALDTLPLFAAARARRDAALAQVEAHGPRWSEIAYAAIEAIARRQPHVHIDDVLAAGVPTPHHPNCWGAVWLRAIRAGVIQRSNQLRPCKTDPRKNAHSYPVYFSCIDRS